VQVMDIGDLGCKNWTSDQGWPFHDDQRSDSVTFVCTALQKSNPCRSPTQPKSTPLWVHRAKIAPKLLTYMISGCNRQASATKNPAIYIFST
jgi:hypothetical protein